MKKKKRNKIEMRLDQFGVAAVLTIIVLVAGVVFNLKTFDGFIIFLLFWILAYAVSIESKLNQTQNEKK